MEEVVSLKKKVKKVVRKVKLVDPRVECALFLLELARLKK